MHASAKLWKRCTTNARQRSLTRITSFSEVLFINIRGRRTESLTAQLLPETYTAPSHVYPHALLVRTRAHVRSTACRTTCRRPDSTRRLSLSHIRNTYLAVDHSRPPAADTQARQMYVGRAFEAQPVPCLEITWPLIMQATQYM